MVPVLGERVVDESRDLTALNALSTTSCLTRPDIGGAQRGSTDVGSDVAKPMLLPLHPSPPSKNAPGLTSTEGSLVQKKKENAMSYSFLRIGLGLQSVRVTSLSREGVGGVARLAAMLMAASVVGCGQDDDAPEAEYIDISEVQSELDELFADDFQLMNTEPFPSQVAQGSFINVWANEIARSVYEDIHVDGEPTGGHLAAGAIIVREILEEDGTRVKNTVLVQQPEGSDPANQDMWFSDTGPDGKLGTDDLSATCFTCHAERPNYAFLFGVPTDFAR
jgi:hypothetical protein